MGLFCHLSGDGTFRQIPAHFRTSHDSARADPTSFRTSHIRCIAYPSLQPRDAHAAPHLWLRVRACDAQRAKAKRMAMKSPENQHEKFCDPAGLS